MSNYNDQALSTEKVENISKEEIMNPISNLTSIFSYHDLAEVFDEVSCGYVPTLKIIKDRSILGLSNNNPRHLIIKGDNHHALSILHSTHRRSVDAILIDCPLNLEDGSFVFNQKKVMGDNDKLSKWISWFKKRIQLIKPLMDDGALVFVFTNDKLAPYIQLLLNDIFGINNHVGEIINKTRTSANDVSNNFSIDHEKIIIFAKSAFDIRLAGLEKDLSRYGNPDKDYRGTWVRGDLTAAAGGPSMKYDIIDSKTKKVYLPNKGRFWAYSEDKMKKKIKQGRVLFPSDESNSEFPYEKKFKAELKSSFKPFSSIHLTSEATKECKKTFGEKVPTCKPLELIKDIISQLPKDSVILDICCGTGTTACAAMSLNIDNPDNEYHTISIDNDEKQIDYTTKRISSAIKYSETTTENFLLLEVEFNIKSSKNDKQFIHNLTPFIPTHVALNFGALNPVKTTKDLSIFQSKTDLLIVWTGDPITIASSEIHDILDEHKFKTSRLVVLNPCNLTKLEISRIWNPILPHAKITLLENDDLSELISSYSKNY